MILFTSHSLIKSSQAQWWIQDHGCGAEYFVEEFVVDLLTIHDNKFIVDDFTTNFCWRCHNKVVVGVLHRRARARDSHDDYHNNFFHNPQQNNSTMTSTKKPMNFYYRNQQQSTTTICCSIVNKISHNEFTRNQQLHHGVFVIDDCQQRLSCWIRRAGMRHDRSPEGVRAWRGSEGGRGL